MKEQKSRVRENDWWKTPRNFADSFYRILEFCGLRGGLAGIIGRRHQRGMNKYTVGMATQGLAKLCYQDVPRDTA